MDAVSGASSLQIQAQQQAQGQPVNPALQHLRAGDTLEAEVLRSPSGETSLLLPGGEQVSVAGAENLPQGELLRLSIVGRTPNGSVMVELAPDNAAGSAAARFATPEAALTAAREVLRALGLEATPMNVRLTAALRGSSLPVNKETLAQLGKALQANPSLSPEQAVFLRENKIPITPRNVSMFGAFQRQEAALGNTLSRLMDILQPAPPQQQPAPAPGDAALGNGGRTLFAPTDTPQQSAPPQQPAQPPVVGEHSVLPPSPPATSQPPSPPAPGDAAATPESGGAVVENGAVMRENGGRTLFAPTDTPQQSATPQQQQPAQPPAVGEHSVLPQSPPATPQPAPGDVAAQTQQPTPNGTAVVENGGRTLFAPTDTPQQSATPQQQPTQPPVVGEHSVLPQPPPASSPQSPAAAVSLSDQALLDKVANLFRRIDRSRASLLPRELDAPKLMRELSEVLRGLEDKAAAMTGESRANLQQVARELESGVKFMSQLNNFTAFVQLPVTVNGERATADLYVFNDSKDKRKIDPENATLFLSLATASAGRVETYVKVIGKNVECDFALETEQTAALVRREMPRLLRLLDAQGFRLQRTAATTQTEPAGVLEVKQRHDRRTTRYQFNALA